MPRSTLARGAALRHGKGIRNHHQGPDPLLLWDGCGMAPLRTQSAQNPKRVKSLAGQGISTGGRYRI